MRIQFDNVSRAALEAFALEGVRSERITVAQARELLGIESRFEMDGFLQRNGVLLPMTKDDVIRDTETALTFAR